MRLAKHRSHGPTTLAHPRAVPSVSLLFYYASRLPIIILAISADHHAERILVHHPRGLPFLWARWEQALTWKDLAF